MLDCIQKSVKFFFVMMLSRAKYITGTVDALQSKTGGGAEWLFSLRRLDLQEVIDALCTLPGVGPKVAACIALFSLDQHHAIPVDTHVWQVCSMSFSHMRTYVNVIAKSDIIILAQLLRIFLENIISAS